MSWAEEVTSGKTSKTVDAATKYPIAANPPPIARTIRRSPLSIAVIFEPA
jgi:hypothetical protein